MGKKMNNTGNQIMSYVMDKLGNIQSGGYLTEDNILISVIFIICVYIFTKAPGPLVDFLAHPFSMTALLIVALYLFKEGNIPLAVILGLLLVVSVITKKENDIKNIMPILNREHFTDKKEEQEDFGEDDEEEEEDEEDFDSDEEDDESEGFVGKKYNPSNLNDTFKNLHDAIHQLENFISSSEA